MVKISFGGYDDGEGSSNPTQKRRRVEQDRQTQGDSVIEDPSSGTEDEEQEQEQEESEDGTEDNALTDEDNALTDEESLELKANPEHNNGSATDDRDRSISVTITDPDVLDCCVCYEPLCAPIFQCENGHIACSNCCCRLGNKCPMCSMPIGYNRCRAIEKVLESIKMPCLNAKYGCKEMFSYSRKDDHEQDCIYLPCLCPHSRCDFVASSKELSLHFSHRHVGSGTQFIYDEIFKIFFNVNDKATVLQEKNDANLFVVHNNRELLGNIVHITCIGPKSKTGFQYEILATSQGSSLLLQSYTKIIQGHIAGAPLTGLLLIPSGFFGSIIQLDIRIMSPNSTLDGD